ncbi:MAG: methyltransferase [Gammaproteobacteria bacterium]|nr:methyltransferase [Gammaproteobacteria bacterium]|tara:strand:+ start:1025 stop:1804 length:780 start_codon:yes stop_codon:yes gene_type:complete
MSHRSPIRAAACSAAIAWALALSPAALGADDDVLKSRLEAAMASDTRSDADKARDDNRKPIETLQFFGLEPDMRVLELLPGGGWYTKLLAPALAGDGELFVAIGTTRVQAMVEEGSLEDVNVVDIDGEFVRDEGERRFRLDGLRIPVDDIDMVLTFRNMHNFTEEGRAGLNAEVFRVLKPGGVYGVVDHTRRHMQADYYENWRRMDPVQMIKEIEAAGFEFVDYSPLHYRPDDELLYEVGRATVTGNTDRFTLLFRKPE